MPKVPKMSKMPKVKAMPKVPKMSKMPKINVCYLFNDRRQKIEFGSRTRRRPKKGGLCRGKHVEVGKKEA